MDPFEAYAPLWQSLDAPQPVVADSGWNFRTTAGNASEPPNEVLGTISYYPDQTGADNIAAGWIFGRRQSVQLRDDPSAPGVDRRLSGLIFASNGDPNGSAFRIDTGPGQIRISLALGREAFAGTATCRFYDGDDETNEISPRIQTAHGAPGWVDAQGTLHNSRAEWIAAHPEGAAAAKRTVTIANYLRLTVGNSQPGTGDNWYIAHIRVERLG